MNNAVEKILDHLDIVINDYYQITESTRCSSLVTRECICRASALEDLIEWIKNTFDE